MRIPIQQPQYKWDVPLDPKTMKNEGFKPPIYGL